MAMIRKPYPKDPAQLSREVYATLKARDILQYYQLREQIQVKWWEGLVMAFLFISGLGFTVTLFYLLPPKNVELYLRFLKLWAVMLVIAGIASLEIVVTKVRAMARILYFQAQMIQELQRHVLSKKEDTEAVSSGKETDVKNPS